MFPAAFEYVRAHSADEALAQLRQHGAEARILAGGQSLVPAMRFRLARPGVLVDINPARELEFLRLDNGALVVGALAAGLGWLPTPGYEPTATGMRIALPHVATFVRVNDAADLVRLAREVRLRR